MDPENTPRTSSPGGNNMDAIDRARSKKRLIEESLGSDRDYSLPSDEGVDMESSSAHSPPATPPKKQQQQPRAISSRASPVKPPSNIIPRRTFQPYRTTTLDTPMFHMILEPLCLSVLHPLLAVIYRIRSCLEHPMHTNILPRWTPSLMPSSIRNATVGEVILMVPLVIFFLRGYHYTFVKINLTDSGKMAAYCIYWAFLTANKSNSVFSFLFGIPFERMIPLHLISAVFSVVLGCFHTHVAFQYGGDDDGDSKHAKFGNDPALGKFLLDGDTNLSGSFLLSFLIVSVSLSFLPIVRRVLFNVWYYSHMLLGVGVLLTLFLHDVSSAVFVTAWWGLDLVVRYGIMAGCRNRATATLRLIGQGERGVNEPAIEISFPRPAGFDYNPGQFVQIAIPKLSIFEFHPISISSAPHEDQVTLHIRQLGDWTSRLVQLARNGTKTTDVWMEGPYGSLSLDLDDDTRYKCALLVSGGIGVTPCQSIGKSLLHQHLQHGRDLKQVKFVWACRNTQMVEDIPPLEGAGQDYSIHGPWHRTVSQEEDVGGSSSSFADRPPASVQVDIYCTRGTRDPEIDTASLPYNLKYGRPDLDAIFIEMKANALALGESSVAVFGCGPNALMEELQQACRKHSVSVVGCQTGVFFDLHREYFDL